MFFKIDRNCKTSHCLLRCSRSVYDFVLLSWQTHWALWCGIIRYWFLIMCCCSRLIAVKLHDVDFLPDYVCEWFCICLFSIVIDPYWAFLSERRKDWFLITCCCSGLMAVKLPDVTFCLMMFCECLCICLLSIVVHSYWAFLSGSRRHWFLVTHYLLGLKAAKLWDAAFSLLILWMFMYLLI